VYIVFIRIGVLFWVLELKKARKEPTDGGMGITDRDDVFTIGLWVDSAEFSRDIHRASR